MLKQGITALLLSVSAVGSATPPPPPPPQMNELANKLGETLTAETFDQYSTLLADDLKTTIDGKLVSSTKGEWLKLQHNLLSKALRKPIALVAGDGNIIVIDSYDDAFYITPGKNPPWDPRFRTRIIKYTIGDDLRVHSIDIVLGGHYIRFAPHAGEPWAWGEPESFSPKDGR